MTQDLLLCRAGVEQPVQHFGILIVQQPAAFAFAQPARRARNSDVLHC